MLSDSRTRAVPTQSWLPRANEGLSPAARVIIIMMATLFGILFIPQNPQPAGAMQYSGIILTSALLLIPAIEAMVIGIKPALNLRNLLLVGVVYWVLADLVQGLYPIEASAEGINTAFLATGLFAVGIAFGGGVRIGGLPAGIRRMVRLEMTDGQVLALATCCFVIGIFYFIMMAGFSPSLIMESLLSRSRFAAPWSRGALGDWHAFIEQLIYFGFLLPPLTAVMYVRSRSVLDLKTIYCALLSIVFVAFPAQGGSRTGVGAVLGAAILVGALLNRRPLRTIHVISLLGTVFAMQVAMNYLLLNRDVGLGAGQWSNWGLERIRVDDNFNRMAQTADFVPAVFPYSGLQFIAFAAVRPIPRALWPDKPVDQGFTVQGALTQTVGDPGASLTAAIIGEAYGGFGLPLVLSMGIVFGLLARWWEQTLEAGVTTGSVLIYGLGAMALFGALRGFVNIVLLSYPILSLWAGTALFRFNGTRAARRRVSA